MYARTEMAQAAVGYARRHAQMPSMKSILASNEIITDNIIDIAKYFASEADGDGMKSCANKR